MSDLISRQAAIDAIDEYDFEFPEYMGWFVTKLRDAMKADLKGVIEELPSAEPKWIPVTRRLPEEKAEVLVTVEVDGKKYIESGMLTSINHGQWETIYDRYVIDVYGRNRNSKVIAWMPLPKRYKEESEDKE